METNSILYRIAKKRLRFYRILLSFVLCLLSVSMFAQQNEIVLEVKTGTLEQALAQFRNLTGSLVAFQKDDVAPYSVKAHTIKGTSAEQVLKKLIQPYALSIEKNGQTFILKKTKVVNKPEAPKNKKIIGRVVDGKTGSGLAGVAVYMDGTSKMTISDSLGNYSLSIPVGRIAVSANSIGYDKQTIIIEQSVNEQDFVLVPAVAESLNAVVVIANRKVNNESSLLNERRNAAVVSDGISAHNIEKTASITTTQALQRVTGVTITDDKYVAIRGMGDRSVIAQLNGARLSSSDPDRSAVPLDLVPAGLLDNINVFKTMTPDKPADASAGIVELKTKSVPDSLILEFTAQLGTNSTIGISGRYNSFKGSDMGFFGQRVKNHDLSSSFLNLKNQYPGGLPQIQQLFLQSRNSPELAKEAFRINSIMQSFPSVLTTSYKSVAPNQIYTVSFGNKYKLFGRQLGVVVAANYYSRTEDRYNGELNQYSIYQGIVTGSPDIYNPLTIPGFITPDHPRLGKYLGYRENSGTMTLNYGGLAGLTYRFNSRNQIQFQYLGSRGSEVQGNNLNGAWQNTGLQFPVYNQVNQLKQSYRTFNTYNLQGEHKVTNGSYAPILSYNLSSSKSTQDEPDFRFTDLADYRKQSFLDPNGQGIVSDVYTFVVGSVHGVGSNGVLNADPNGRKYRYLKENNYNLKGDITQPFSLWGQRQLFKVGYNFLRRNRDFTENILGIPGSSAGGDIDLLAKAKGNLDQLVSASNIGLNLTTDADGAPRVGGFLYQIRKSPNNYRGTYETQAFYGMLDLKFSERLRATGGVRFESTNIGAHVDTTNVFNPQVAAGNYNGNGTVNTGSGISQPNTRYKESFKPYYSINLTYNLNHNMNFRLAYSTTLARPELRELTNIFEFDPFQFAVIGGNPNLKNQFTRSEDFRWEWFPNAGEVIAASAFAKQIDHQLNKVFIYNAQGAASLFPEFPLIEYQNDVNQGHLFGIELEVRKNLGLLTPALKNFFLGTNMMFASSEITKNTARLDASRTIDRTASDKSPLFEQPPYSINAYLDYDNNKSGTRISANFNIVGERLTQVQLDGAPDIYSRPVPVLDFVFSQRFLKRFVVKGFLKNVLNPPYRDVYATPRNGGLYHGVRYIQHQYWRGAEYALGLTYNLF